MTPDTGPPTERSEEGQKAICARCPEVLDRTGSPPWCKACWAKYHREHKATRDEMKESRGYCAGISAMRAYLATRFDEYGPAQFSGTEIAGYIRQSKGPI